MPMSFTLKDHYTDVSVPAGDRKEPAAVTGEVKVAGDGQWLEINIEGYGENDSEPGFGSPILVELWEGRLRVITFPDINSEEAKIVDVEGARETNRKPELETVED